MHTIYTVQHNDKAWKKWTFMGTNCSLLSFSPADKHCDAPPEDIEPCPLLLTKPSASPSKGFEGFTDMSSAGADVFLHHISLNE